jgi:hypothetical protein
MSAFVSGPAAGVTLMFRRGPLYLRVVRGANGWDVLDQVDDAPAADEIVYVYRRIGDSRAAHLLYRGRGKQQSGWYEFADYEHVEPDVDTEELRRNAAWRAWVEEQPEATQSRLNIT